MLLTRRSFNAAATLGLVSGWPGVSVGQDARQGETLPFVHEVTIAAPDVISVEVRDPAYVPGRLVPLGRPHSEKLGAWVQIDGQWGLVVGRDRDHVRLQDRAPPAYLDRKRVDIAPGYVIDRAGPVTAVYRKSTPYDTGFSRGEGGETIRGCSFKHFIYLKLARPLAPNATYKIRWPGQVLPDTQFSFDPRATRAIAIRANQHGYRAGDAAKSAYLSLWMPGAPAEGAVDFAAYGLKEFAILRADGAEVFRGPIQLRKGPADPEPGNGFPTPVLEYASSMGPPLRVMASERGGDIVLSAPGHAFKAGQRIWLSRFGGTFAGLNGPQAVQSVTPDQVRIKPGRPVQLPAVTSAAGFAAPSYRANRTGTFVFEMKFDAWTATDGEYRLHVPGLGVSDPFRVADTAWLDAARVSFEGLYNHRSGIALDGRFGYTRPASYRPGQTVEVRRSKLPLTFSSDYVGFIDYTKGAAAPWVTSASDTESYWGGYMDAGDWDRRIQHLNIPYMLLDIFEMLPESARTARLGVPKSSEYLDKAIYGGEDDLPDIIHEAIWTIDFFRRLQLPSGDVQGGIESGGGLQHGEPSYLEHHTVFVFAPDHLSSFRYAMAAGKLARILSGLGRTNLAKLYADSALAAWQAGERGFADPDTYYTEAIATARTAGAWDAGAWDKRRATIQKEAREFRMAAAAVLFRLTGETMYRAIFEEIWNAGGLDLGYQVADAVWEYVSSERPVDETIREAARGALTRTAKFVTDGQAGAAYPSLKHFFAPFGWGQGSAPDYNVTLGMIRAHRITGNPALIRALQLGSSHILGANQAGLSFTLGLGQRNVRHPLHEDHLAMGVAAPRGITIYGWSTKEQVDFDWLFGAYWTALPESDDTRERADQRQLEPNRWALPIYEFLVEHPLLVAQQEYTVHQTIATTASVWLYLNAVER